MSGTQTLTLSFQYWKKYLAQFFKILITICALGYILYRISTEDLSLAHALEGLGLGELGLCLLALAFVPINWGLEALKWKLALRDVYPNYKYLDACKGVLAGISTGIFTPNRVGDYAGRLMFLSKRKRWEAGVVLLVDRLCQMVITLWVGVYCLGFLWFMEPDKTFSLLPLSAQNIELLLIIIALSAISLPLILIYIGKIKVPDFLPKRWKPYLININQAFEVLRPSQVLLMLGMGALRYVCFSFQYLLLLWVFGYTGTYTLAFLMIGLIFLIKSLIPYISFTELGLRESVAIFVMGIWQVSTYAAISSTFFLYIMNLVIPALVGLAVLYVKR